MNTTEINTIDYGAIVLACFTSGTVACWIVGSEISFEWWRTIVGLWGFMAPLVIFRALQRFGVFKSMTG